MRDQTIHMYLKDLSTAEGLPGGGSAAALAGAISASLSGMVTDIYSSRPKESGRERKWHDIQQQSNECLRQLEELMEQDATSFDEVQAAFKLPQQTADQKKERQQKIESGLYVATGTPLDIMKVSKKVLDILRELVEMNLTGSIVNDVAVGILFVKTAIDAAYLNVLVNTKRITNNQKREEFEQKAAHLKKHSQETADHLYESVIHYLQTGEWMDTRANEGATE